MTSHDNKEKNYDVESSQCSATVEADVNIVSQTPVLAKSFNLFSACATGITTGNAWAVLGGGIVCSRLLPKYTCLY